MIKYKSEHAIVEIHFADISDSERQKRQKKLEEGLEQYYKSVVECIGRWPDETERSEPNARNNRKQAAEQESEWSDLNDRHYS